MSEGVYTEGREGHGHIKSYVRRAGRMSEAQARYYAELMPKIGVALAITPRIAGTAQRTVLPSAAGPAANRSLRTLR